MYVRFQHIYETYFEQLKGILLLKDLHQHLALTCIQYVYQIFDPHNF